MSFKKGDENMLMDSFFGSSSLLKSEAATSGAESFIEDIRSDKLRMDILPNSYEQYNGQLEEENYISFCNFIKSRNGKMIIAMLDAEDEQGDNGVRE